MDIYAFYWPWVWQQGPVGAAAFYALGCLVLYELAGVLAAIYQRAGLSALLVTAFGFALVLLAIAWVISARGWWHGFLAALASATPLGVAAILLAVSVLEAAWAQALIARYEVR